MQWEGNHGVRDVYRYPFFKRRDSTMRRLLTHSLELALVMLIIFSFTIPVAFAAPGEQYLYDQPGDKNYVNNTNVLERNGPNNQSTKITAPRAQADATFIAEPIVVDGIRDAAWEAATAYPIANTFNTTMTAAIPAGTQGNVR